MKQKEKEWLHAALTGKLPGAPDKEDPTNAILLNLVRDLQELSAHDLSPELRLTVQHLALLIEHYYDRKLEEVHRKLNDLRKGKR